MEVKKTRTEGLDKFYTRPEISAKCVATVGEKYGYHQWDLVIEPSAGNGSFFNIIPSSNRFGIDISTQCEGITEMDFFDYRPSLIGGRILVIGNPPFGRVSSLAIKFFNHAAEFADVIAFIIPRTFRRISVQNRLDKNFHLVHDEEIPTKPCSFEPAMMVKSCFQIWEKMAVPRECVKLETTHIDWAFLPYGKKDSNGQPTPPVGADFAIRAYGGKCGEIRDTDLDTLRPKSWHFILSTGRSPDVLKSRFMSLDYSSSVDTARQNSLGRGELVKLYRTRDRV